MTHMVLALGLDGSPAMRAEARLRRDAEHDWDEAHIRDVPQAWTSIATGLQVDADYAVGELVVRQHWSVDYPRPWPVIVSGEWVWDEREALEGGRAIDAWRYTRTPGATGHRLAAFTRVLADRRPNLHQHLDDLHSADARADTAIHRLQDITARLADRLEAALISDKGRLTESDRDRRENERLATEIGAVRALRDEIDRERSDHFLPASRMRIAHALVAGHPLGQPVVPVEQYYALAFRLAALLHPETDRDTRLGNMVANLASDHARAELDRLVPATAALHSVIEARALYDIIVRPPPQFGSRS